MSAPSPSSRSRLVLGAASEAVRWCVEDNSARVAGKRVLRNPERKTTSHPNGVNLSLSPSHACASHPSSDPVARGLSYHLSEGTSEFTGTQRVQFAQRACCMARKPKRRIQLIRMLHTAVGDEFMLSRRCTCIIHNTDVSTRSDADMLTCQSLAEAALEPGVGCGKHPTRRRGKYVYIHRKRATRRCSDRFSK